MWVRYFILGFPGQTYVFFSRFVSQSGSFMAEVFRNGDRDYYLQIAEVY